MSSTNNLPAHDLRRWHRDEEGVISVLSVFAALMLTMVLGMVINVGQHVDGKVRMQNAADAAAHSGGVVIARGLNGLAYTNRLLCEVFALTAWVLATPHRQAMERSPWACISSSAVSRTYDARPSTTGCVRLR